MLQHVRKHVHLLGIDGAIWFKYIGIVMQNTEQEQG